MVRINLINPRCLADQHLIAEYDEILMLLGYVKKYPKTGIIPKDFRLGKGHILFFKDKLLYLKRRHELLKKEMVRRNFRPSKTISLSRFPGSLRNDWIPSKKDKELLKKRLRQRIRLKPGWYRYEGEVRPVSFFLRSLK